MLSSASSTGLGIDFQTREGLPQTQPAFDGAPGMPSHEDPRQRPRRTLTGPRAPPKRRPKTTVPALLAPQGAAGVPSSLRSGTIASSKLRSIRSMRGLEGAEIGDSMVSFDLGEGNMQEGSRIGLDPLTPGGCTLPRHHMRGVNSQESPVALPRDVTLLSLGASHLGGGGADLKFLLGDSNARLKSGAVILPGPSRNFKNAKSSKELGVALEQAKSRARVEVDIVLESNVCVQGGYVRGHIKIRVRKRSKKQSPVSLSEGKIRIVGYETIPDGDERHIFYQCAAPLSSVTDAVQNVYCSPTDEDGFAQGVEGVHVLPFALHLPPDASYGHPKGMVSIGSATIIRYIAMISIRVKDADTGRRSLAHFYRDCEVWPLLNFNAIMQPAPRPIQATTNKSMSLIGGSSAKVRLNAQLHRLHWPAGSRCPISVHVTNGSKKTIKGLLLTLVRTTTVFRPQLSLDTAGDRDPDSCQTTTVHKVVGETSLEMGAGVVKRHASAKGWWTGISPGQELEFSHFIMLPPDALSVTRSRLLEVEYSIRVTLSAGSLASDIFVTLPIRIFNFISIDPPPSAGLLSDSGAYIRSTQMPAVAALERAPSTYSRSTARPRTTLPTTLEDDEEAEEDEPQRRAPQATFTTELRVTNPDLSPGISAEPVPLMPSTGPLCAAPSEASMYSDASTSQDGNEDGDLDTSPELPYLARDHRPQGNLELEGNEGSDEELEAVLKSAKIDQGRFGNLQGTGHGRKSGGKGSRLGGVKHPSRETTPRMEGVGSGTRGFRRKDNDAKLLVARLQERARRGLQQEALLSSSDITLITTDPESEDMSTPKVGTIGYNDRAPSMSSDGEMSSTSDCPPEPDNLVERRPSRKLPCPPANAVQPARHSHIGIIRKPTTKTGLPKAVDLWGNRISQHAAAHRLPQPPAIPQISGKITASSLRAVKTLQGQSTMSDSEALRKEITRPPKSPVRPPRSPLRVHGGSLSVGDESDSREVSPIREKIKALEHRVQSNGM